MPNGFKKFLPVWLIAFIATIAIAWILPVERDSLFHVIYYFIIAAFTIELCISYYAFKNEKEVAYPLFIYSILGVVMIVIATWKIISKHLWVKPWLMAIIYIIILALHYLLLIILNTSLKKNVERDEHVKENTNTMLTLTNQVKALHDSTNNEDIYRLYEAFRYSDKGTNNADIEKRLIIEVDKLQKRNSNEEIKQDVDRIIKLLSERK